MRTLVALCLCLLVLGGCDLSGHSTPRHAVRPVDDPGSVVPAVRSATVRDGSVRVVVSLPACAARPRLQVLGYDARQVRAVAVADAVRPCPGRRTTTFTASIALQGRALRLGDVVYPAAGGDQSVCALHWATSGTQRDDLPTARQVVVVGCYDRWLVVDVGSAVRWFAARGPDGRWRVVATTTSPGCRDVSRAAPAFPRRYCSGLQAP